MREIIKKSKFKIKNLPHGIVIDEKEIIDEKTSAKTIQSFFFQNIGPKLASKIPVSKIHILNNMLSMKVEFLKEKALQ